MKNDQLLTEIERQEKYLAELPKTFNFPLFNTKRALESQRQNGYRNTAVAAREIVDNSLEAKADKVHVVFETVKNKTREIVKSVAFIDNGAGMVKDMARFALSWGGGTHFDDPNFIGKFGFGLPNASINQTRKVELYTRTKKTEPFTKAWLDLDTYTSFDQQTVPEPVTAELPDFVKKYLEKVGWNFEHGTIIVWSEPDQLTYKTPKVLESHLVDDFGVCYQYLMNDSIELTINGTKVEPVDPLFLNPKGRLYVPKDEGGAIDVLGGPMTIYAKTYKDDLTGAFHVEKVTDPSSITSHKGPMTRISILRNSLFLLAIAPSLLSAQMKPGSLHGPVTQAELDSLLAQISGMQPAASNEKNAWAYGTSGQAVRALGLIYQIDRDPRFVDQMIRFCDAELSERNDLAPSPVGQQMIWTGRIDPVWPNDFSRPPLSTGGSEGDLIGNLGNCAVTILNTRTLWKKVVPAGDPHHYGATYVARARTYVKQADFSIDRHTLNGLVDLSHNNHQYFSAGSTYKGGTPVPWNQIMMFNYGFQTLSKAHQLLHNDPARATRYHSIVADNVRWFFDEGSKTVTTKKGRPAYDWGYALPAKEGEDSVHARMDIVGFYLSYLEGGYPINRVQMTAFANTFTDIITLAPGSYAGRVDGTNGANAHGAPTDRVKSGFLFLAEFRPDAYDEILSHAITEGQAASATEGATVGDIDLFAAFLWAKYRHTHYR